MAHLVLGKKTTKKDLVALVKKYNKEYHEATDNFAKDEISCFLDEISYFCILRGGFTLRNEVFTLAKQ